MRLRPSSRRGRTVRMEASIADPRLTTTTSMSVIPKASKFSLTEASVRTAWEENDLASSILSLSLSMATTSCPLSYKVLATLEPKLPKPMTANFIIVCLLYILADQDVFFNILIFPERAAPAEGQEEGQGADTAGVHHQDDHRLAEGIQLGGGA